MLSGGKVVGASMFSGYSWNERKVLSLGFVEEQYAKPGTQLTLVWGEEGGGTGKTTVERHKQTELRVTVGPTPYAKQARETYHTGLAHRELRLVRPKSGQRARHASPPCGLGACPLCRVDGGRARRAEGGAGGSLFLGWKTCHPNPVSRIRAGFRKLTAQLAEASASTHFDGRCELADYRGPNL